MQRCTAVFGDPQHNGTAFIRPNKSFVRSRRELLRAFRHLPRLIRLVELFDTEVRGLKSEPSLNPPNSFNSFPTIDCLAPSKSSSKRRFVIDELKISEYLQSH